MKWFIRHLPWLALCAVGVWFTPAAFSTAGAYRGYAALGGEVFVPLLAPAAWYLVHHLKKAAEGMAVPTAADEK